MMGTSPRRAWLSWASVGLLAAMCGILAILQYRWTGEIAGAERTRLHEELQVRLNTLSRALNQEITGACQALFPSVDDLERLGREGAYSAQYSRWKETHERMFRHLALAVPEQDGISLLILNLDTAQYTRADWPPEWSGMLDRLLQRRRGGPMRPMPPDGSALFE